MPTGESPRLAVVVAKSRAQTVIDALRAEGVYDADRHVREWDDGAVAIPVTDPPDSVDYREVVRQVGEPRLRTLADHLREMGWTDEEIDRAPGSWAVVGTVVLVEVGDAPRPDEIGDALLALHGEADTVLARGPITGAHREPAVEVIAGSGDTETVHREHGTAYAMDLSKVMFSPGNEAERKRMSDVVADGERREGEHGEASETRAGSERTRERVLDMFAGIGYFTLPMARAGAEVTAVERNPDSFRYLIENVRLNDVGSRVHPYRADCRDVVDGFAAEAPADRVVMGPYDATEPDGDGSYTYLDAALAALAPGGVIHAHESTPNDLAFDRPVERLKDAAESAGRTVEVLETREVKSYSEGVAHVVVDARVD